MLNTVYSVGNKTCDHKDMQCSIHRYPHCRCIPYRWTLLANSNPHLAKETLLALTVIDMLTNFVWCIPLQTKTADEVIHAYLKNVYAQYGGSQKILSDNGSEFKNKLFG